MYSLFTVNFISLKLDIKQKYQFYLQKILTFLIYKTTEITAAHRTLYICYTKVFWSERKWNVINRIDCLLI